MRKKADEGRWGSFSWVCFPSFLPCVLNTEVVTSAASPPLNPSLLSSPALTSPLRAHGPHHCVWVTTTMAQNTQWIRQTLSKNEKGFNLHTVSFPTPHNAFHVTSVPLCLPQGDTNSNFLNLLRKFKGWRLDMPQGTFSCSDSDHCHSSFCVDMQSEIYSFSEGICKEPALTLISNIFSYIRVSRKAEGKEAVNGNP